MTGIYTKIVSFLVLVLILAVNTTSAQDLKGLKKIKENSSSVKSGGLLTVDVSGADVVVDAWDKDEVYVVAWGDDRVKDKVEITIEKTSDGVLIETKRDKSISNWFGGGYSLTFVINVPKRFNVEISTSGGDIRFAGVTGNLNLETSGGDVHVKGSAGQLFVSTSGGDITASKHSGDISLETSGGDIEVNSSNGKVNCETSGGDIIIIHVGANKGIYASTSGGDIILEIPKDFKGNGHFETSGGDIECDFSNTNTKKVSRGTFIADFNGGGIEVMCETSGGDISIKEHK